MPHQVDSAVPVDIEFATLHRQRQAAEEYVNARVEELQEDGTYDWILQELLRESSWDPEDAAPGQGLRSTGYEGKSAPKRYERQRLSDDLIKKTIHGWLYYLYLFNHPERLDVFLRQSAETFKRPRAHFNAFFFFSRLLRNSITINDIRLNASGSDRPRVQRGEAQKEGLMVSYKRQMTLLNRLTNWLGRTNYNEGRAQARGVLVGAANQDITGTPMALASLAQVHSLVCVPRNGIFTDIEKQVALAKGAMEWLEHSPILKNKNEAEQQMLLEAWKHNLVGVLDANPEKVLVRAKALYDAGIRTFRIYSPEPSSGLLESLKKLRAIERELGWEPIEIFVGQVVDVKQALALEAAGANALYFGIGGGGRCITGVIAGLTINWPELVWRLRGKIGIPMIVEGGANDHLPQSLAVGASGIGVAGKLAATIETPGGVTYFVDEFGNWFKFYGGEASNRTRKGEGRDALYGVMQHEEGQTTVKLLSLDQNESTETIPSNGNHDEPGVERQANDNPRLPTMLQVYYDMQQGIVGGEVFQNAHSIPEMQERGARSIRKASPYDRDVSNTH